MTDFTLKDAVEALGRVYKLDRDGYLNAIRMLEIMPGPVLEQAIKDILGSWRKSIAPTPAELLDAYGAAEQRAKRTVKTCDTKARLERDIARADAIREKERQDMLEAMTPEQRKAYDEQAVEIGRRLAAGEPVSAIIRSPSQ